MSYHLNSLYVKKPTPIANAKKPIVFKRTSSTPPLPVPTPSTIVKTTIPITSSIIAALIIVCPISVLIFPNSSNDSAFL